MDPVAFYDNLYKDPPVPTLLLDFPSYIQDMAYHVVVKSIYDYGPLNFYVRHISQPNSYNVAHKLTLLYRILRMIDTFKNHDPNIEYLNNIQSRVWTIINFYKSFNNSRYNT